MHASHYDLAGEYGGVQDIVENVLIHNVTIKNCKACPILVVPSPRLLSSGN